MAMEYPSERNFTGSADQLDATERSPVIAINCGVHRILVIYIECKLYAGHIFHYHGVSAVRFVICVVEGNIDVVTCSK